MSYELGKTYLLGEENRRRLSLTREPFLGQADVLFDVPSWQLKFQLLQHLILYSNLLVAMVGKKGIGKTTFLSELMASLPQDYICHKVTATEALTPKELQQVMLQVFSLSSLQSVTYNDIIGGYIQQIHDRKQYCVLIIDDAHLLSKDVLDMLYYYIAKQNNADYLQFILAGDYSLEKIIESSFPDKLESATHLFEIPLMSQAEVKAYLAHQLKDAGFSEAFPFDDETVTKIFSRSLGNISQINLLAQKAFYEMYYDGETTSYATNIPQIAKASSIALVLIVIFIYLLPSSPKNKLEAKKIALPSSHQQNKKSSSPIKLGSRRQDKAQDKKQFIPISYIPSHRNMVLKPKATNKNAKNRKGRQPIKPIKIQAVKRRPVRKKYRVVTKVTEPSLERKLSALKESRQTRIDKKNVILDSVVVIPDPKLKKKTTSQSKPMSLSVTKKASRPIKKKTVIKKRQTKRTVKRRMLRGRKAFVIQLVASSKLQEVEAFVKKYNVKSGRFYKTMNRGKDWYVLVVGNYVSKAVAKKAIKGLPRRLRNLKPWVRASKELSYID